MKRLLVFGDGCEFIWHAMWQTNLNFSPSRVQGLSLNGEEQQPNFVALFEARMAELVDAHGSGPCSRKRVQVQFLFRALFTPEN